MGGATPLEAQRAARQSSLDMTYQYTLPDVERETAQQNAMFDKLMEMPEGKPQQAGKLARGRNQKGSGTNVARRNGESDAK